MNMKRILPLLLSLAMALALCACGSQSSSDGAQTSVSGSTGVEDGVLTVGMECAYAPYNWTQMDDSNGAVPISNVPGSYANGYDVMIAKKICEANGWKLEIVSSAWESLTPAVQAGSMDANFPYFSVRLTTSICRKIQYFWSCAWSSKVFRFVS